MDREVTAARKLGKLRPISGRVLTKFCPGADFSPRAQEAQEPSLRWSAS